MSTKYFPPTKKSGMENWPTRKLYEAQKKAFLSIRKPRTRNVVLYYTSCASHSLDQTVLSIPLITDNRNATQHNKQGCSVLVSPPPTTQKDEPYIHGDRPKHMHACMACYRRLELECDRTYYLPVICSKTAKWAFIVNNRILRTASYRNHIRGGSLSPPCENTT